MQKPSQWIALLLCFTFILSPVVSAVEPDQVTQDGTPAVTEPDVTTPPTDSDAADKPEAPPDSETPSIVTVKFQDGDEILLELTVESGEAPDWVPTQDANGNPILGWVSGGKKIADPTQTAVTEDTVYTVWTAPALNTKDHIVYINGQGEGKFAPDSQLTRSAAAKMICSLLQDFTPGQLTATFSDVTADAWYEQPVTLLASLGILNGYEDGTFRPDRVITRAEFVYILASFFPRETAKSAFQDVPETHWAKDAIASASSKGWIKGYEDGTFRPDKTILRSEAVKVLNAVLGRSAAAQETKNLIRENNICIFTDVKAGDWYYADVMEASIPHEYTQDGSAEVWTDFTYQSCGYEPGFQKIGSAYYIVDGNRQITFQTPGMQTMDGKLYYVAPDGSIPGEPGPREIGNALYYTNEDGSLLTNGTVGYLYFGNDGRYTSGNSEIDRYVEQLLASCTNSGMSRGEKLRAAYLVIREYRYLSRPHQGRGTTNWTESTALWMFQNKKGNCYCYSGAFYYVAHRLGYQAYVISGGYGPNNGDHAWVMIGDRIYDPCLENVYRYRSSVVHYYDLYNILPQNAPIAYYFP